MRIVAVVVGLVCAAVASAQTATVTFAMPPRVEPQVDKVPVLLSWQRDIVASCLVLEAASDGADGMRAVMSVIRNRAKGYPKRYANCALAPKQFSALNPATVGTVRLWRLVAKAQRDRMWSSACAIVDEACLAEWNDTTGGATHYTRSEEHPAWASSLKRTVTIGGHTFYR